MLIACLAPAVALLVLTAADHARIKLGDDGVRGDRKNRECRQSRTLITL